MAAMAVAAGMYDAVLAVGAEKMREVPPRSSLAANHIEKLHPMYAKGRTAPGASPSSPRAISRSLARERRTSRRWPSRITITAP